MGCRAHTNYGNCGFPFEPKTEHSKCNSPGQALKVWEFITNIKFFSLSFFYLLLLIYLTNYAVRHIIVLEKSFTQIEQKY